MSNIEINAVVPAAGTGSRFGHTIPKQYACLAGKTVLEHSIQALLDIPVISRVIVALHPDDRHWQSLPLATDPRVHTVVGGKSRRDSVFAALGFLDGKCAGESWILVHDAARPCCTANDIRYLIDQLHDEEVGGIFAIPVSDTIKTVDCDHVVNTVDRSLLWQAQTPQMFRLARLYKALKSAHAKGVNITDESAAMEVAGYQPRVVEGKTTNLKITTAQDLMLAEFYLSAGGG